jgi:hypothetical protein
MLYSSSNIIRAKISRRVTLAGHVARMVEMRNSYKIWLEILKGREHLEELGTGGRII